MILIDIYWDDDDDDDWYDVTNIRSQYFFLLHFWKFILTYGCIPMISAPMNDDRSCFLLNWLQVIKSFLLAFLRWGGRRVWGDRWRVPVGRDLQHRRGRPRTAMQQGGGVSVNLKVIEYKKYNQFRSSVTNYTWACIEEDGLESTCSREADIFTILGK